MGALISEKSGLMSRARSRFSRAAVVVAESGVHHAGVENEVRVRRAEAQRLLDIRHSLLRAACLEQRPGDCVGGVDAVRLRLVNGERGCERVIHTDVVVGEEEG